MRYRVTVRPGTKGLRGMIVALAVLIPAVDAQAQQFGAAAVVGEGMVLIGAPTDDQGPGRVYVYRRSGDEWLPGRHALSPRGRGRARLLRALPRPRRRMSYS